LFKIGSQILEETSTKHLGVTDPPDSASGFFLILIQEEFHCDKRQKAVQ
jgi:hypothetical protein